MLAAYKPMLVHHVRMVSGANLIIFLMNIKFHEIDLDKIFPIRC